MVTVGTKELENRLSHYLRLVRAGARIVVTNHGRPVAELGPVSSVHGARDAAWAAAAARGQVTLATRRGFPPFRPIRLPKGCSVSDAVLDEDRS